MHYFVTDLFLCMTMQELYIHLRILKKQNLISRKSYVWLLVGANQSWFLTGMVINHLKCLKAFRETLQNESEANLSRITDV